MAHRIAVLPGDGIGPEVTGAALEVLDAAAGRFNFQVERKTFALSATHYLATGELFADVADQIHGFDAILFGAIGDPSVPPGVLERGVILAMRTGFRQAANVRPVRLYPGVSTPVKGLSPERCDIVFVRENTEGAYASEGLTVHQGTPHEVAVQESINTRAAIARVMDYAFRLAMQRRRHVTLCHKSNVLVAAGRLWNSVLQETAARYPEVTHDYVHVDAMCFHLPLNPERFDVVVTDNLFGDIVTDLGAVIQGGLGVSASANLNLDGTAPSMFEAIHGSAPDIAGTNTANPAGAILALALLLGHLGEGEAAAAVEAATVSVLGDQGDDPHSALGTAEFGAQVAARVVTGEYDPGLVPNPLMRALAALAE